MRTRDGGIRRPTEASRRRRRSSIKINILSPPIKYESRYRSLDRRLLLCLLRRWDGLHMVPYNKWRCLSTRNIKLYSGYNRDKVSRAATARECTMHLHDILFWSNDARYGTSVRAAMHFLPILDRTSAEKLLAGYRSYDPLVIKHKWQASRTRKEMSRRTKAREP